MILVALLLPKIEVTRTIIRQFPQFRQLAPIEREVIRTKWSDILNDGVITPSNTFASGPGKKKDEGMRFCFDYRKLNAVTKQDAYSLSSLYDAIDRLQEAQYFTTINFLPGYWRVKLNLTEAEKSAFLTPVGLHEFTRLFLEACNAPGTFQVSLIASLAI